MDQLIKLLKNIIKPSVFVSDMQTLPWKNCNQIVTSFIQFVNVGMAAIFSISPKQRLFKIFRQFTHIKKAWRQRLHALIG